MTTTLLWHASCHVTRCSQGDFSQLRAPEIPVLAVSRKREGCGAHEELEGVVGVVQLREEAEIVALALVVDDARHALFGGVGEEGRLEELMLQEASFSLVVLVDVVQHEDVVVVQHGRLVHCGGDVRRKSS